DGQMGTLEDPRLEATTERHRISLPPPPMSAPAPGDPLTSLARNTTLGGLVLEMAAGCPNAKQLKMLGCAAGLGRGGLAYWPGGGAVECITPERLASYRRHAFAVTLYKYVGEPFVRVASIPRRIRYVLRDVPLRDLPKWAVLRLERTRLFARPFRYWRMWREIPTRELPRRIARRLGRMLGLVERVDTSPPAAQAHEAEPSGPSPMVRHAQRLGAVREARQAAKAVPFPPFLRLPDPQHRIDGCGVYLRTDFWSPIKSGGSYGHTCYVAKELAAV